MGRLINIDNGGTLTDFCAFDGEQLLFTKTLTTPHDLSACFFDGLGQLAILAYGEEDVARLLQDTDYIRYSTTQGTNALVERRGLRLGLITSSDTALAMLRTSNEQCALFDTLVGDRTRTVDATLDDEHLDVALTRSINELSSTGANRIVVSLNVEHCNAEERRFERIVLRRYPSHLLGALPVTFAAEMSDDPDYTRRTWTTLFNAFLHPAMERFLYSAERRLKQHRTRRRSEELLLLVHFGLFVCPPWFLMSYCRCWVYYPGMYYIFCCFESVTGRTHLHRHYRTFLG